MANLLNNRVNVMATPEQLKAVKNAFQTILDNLPFLVGLTSDERRSLLSMDINNKTFTEDAINAAVNNPTLVPAYVSVNGIQTDLALFEQMDELSGLANQLSERIDDTKMVAGSEAYQGSLTLYRAFGTAADAGILGSTSIVEQLKKRFANNAAKAATTEAPQAPPVP